VQKVTVWSKKMEVVWRVRSTKEDARVMAAGTCLGCGCGTRECTPLPNRLGRGGETSESAHKE